MYRGRRRASAEDPACSAWINGSLYLELHGREDGRTRSIVFVQMAILVLLAVFTAEAADGSGRGFAVVYATYQVVQTWLWYTVWRQDRRDHPESLRLAGGYVVGTGVSATAIGASTLLPATPRLILWAGLGVAWIVGITLAAHRWIYFDLVGSRLPRANRVALANWVMSHLPIALAITAAGAGMVSLTGHAHDASTPAGTSWLLAGAVATAWRPWSSPSRRWPTPSACLWCSTPFAGAVRRRGDGPVDDLVSDELWVLVEPLLPAPPPHGAGIVGFLIVAAPPALIGHLPPPTAGGWGGRRPGRRAPA